MLLCTLVFVVHLQANCVTWYGYIATQLYAEQNANLPIVVGEFPKSRRTRFESGNCIKNRKRKARIGQKEAIYVKQRHGLLIFQKCCHVTKDSMLVEFQEREIPF